MSLINNPIESSLDANLNVLRNVAKVLRDPSTTYEEMKVCLLEYQELMLSLVNKPWSEGENNVNLEFNNGVAIAPTKAAKCLNDFTRTKIFIRGIFNAIEQLKKDGKDEIHIFYAGTGPYATLILPILACYPTDFIKCSLLEIHEESFKLMQEVMRNLKFEDQVKEFILADATSYQFEENIKIDILISETMYAGLTFEQQVPILMNLVPQLKDPFVLIPQNIKCTLALMKDLRFLPNVAESKEEDYCQRLSVLLETNIAEMCRLNAQKNNDPDWKFPEQKLNVSYDVIQDFHNFVVLTDIQAYEADHIDMFESVLTMPVSLTEFDDTEKDQVISIRYKIDENPGYVFEMKNA